MNLRRVVASVMLIAAGLRGQPASIAAETGRLVFRAAALRGGTLRQQVDGALRELKSAGRVVKVRAFVTLGADASVVDAAIRRAFSAKDAPVVGLVQIAKLADPAALVLVEAVAEAKQVENPNGLVFISGQLTQQPTGATVASLVARPAANLKSIAAGLGVEGSDFLRVTCFASSVEDAVQVRALVGGTFPLASVSVMQIQKAPANSFVECDAVARLRAKAPARLVNPTSAAFAQAAVVTAPTVLFTSTFGSPSNDDAGVRAAFAKLQGAVEAGGSTMDRVFYAYAYPGDQAMLDRFRALRFEYLVRANAPASTNLVFEGAAGAKLGLDAIVASPEAEAVVQAGRRLRPEVTWQSKSVLRGDFSCRGRSEAAILGTTADAILVAIFVDGITREPQVLRYPKDVFASGSMLGIEVEDLDFDVQRLASDLGTALEGLRRSKTCKGITLRNHQEDAIHIYWNRVKPGFQEWRL